MSKLTLRLEAYEKDARQLIAEAQQLADERGNAEVEPLHLLYRLVEGTETVQQAVERAGVDPTEDIRFIWTFELDIRGSNSWTGEDLEQLLAYIDGGKMKPLISEVLPLEETARGVHMLADRQVIGKIIINP